MALESAFHHHCLSLFMQEVMEPDAQLNSNTHLADFVQHYPVVCLIKRFWEVKVDHISITSCADVLQDIGMGVQQCERQDLPFPNLCCPRLNWFVSPREPTILSKNSS